MKIHQATAVDKPTQSTCTGLKQEMVDERPWDMFYRGPAVGA